MIITVEVKNGNRFPCTTEEAAMVMELEKRGFSVDRIIASNTTINVKFTDGIIARYCKVSYSEPISSFYEYIVKTSFRRPIYITDGTETRLLTTMEHIGGDTIRCRLDDGRFFYIYPGFENDLIGIGLLETPNGLYIAPRRWI